MTPITLPRAVVQQVRDALAQATPKPCEGDDDYAERGFADHKAAIDALDEALAQHTAEVRSLRGECVEWLCARCQTIHPSQRGRTFLQPCPECGDAMEPTSFNIRALRRMDALTEAARMGLEALDACLDALQRIREAGGQSTSAEIAAETAIDALSAALPQQN